MLIREISISLLFLNGKENQQTKTSSSPFKNNNEIDISLINIISK
jgi:hypothetical protein